MQPAKTVAIMTKPGVARAAEVVPRLLEFLAEHGVAVRCDEETAEYVSGVEGMPRFQTLDGADMVILLGGDGTLLSAVRAMRGRDIPLFPVNLGSLGFLTTITVDELYSELAPALRGEQQIGRRRLLRCEVIRQGKRISSYEALNDIVVDNTEIARMIHLDASVDGQLVCSYRADGLIVSTPTGSTAYSLSAGGPIIFPTVDALVVTPICPHTLTNRPVIVPSTSVIELVTEDKDDACYLTIDGQIGEPLKGGDVIRCQRSDNYVSLVRPPWQKFFDVLREKLSWG